MLLNVEADHLDRHGTLEDYLAAKLQIFARQGNDDVAVAPFGLGVEDLGGCARRVPFGPGGELDDRAGHLWWDGEPLIAHEEIRLRGAHNRANAAAAAAIALARGIDPRRRARRRCARSPASSTASRRSRAVDGVLFVNDSKATNVASTLVALASFARRPRAPHPRRPGQGPGLLGRCAAARTRSTSSARTPSASAARSAGSACGDLATAVARARAAARPGDVVLLSPACASFDQFEDFEARGRAFRRARALTAARRRRGTPAARGGVELAVVHPPPPTEAVLLTRACGGDLDAYEQLVRLHQQIAFRTALVLTRNAADAEEAAQDAFVKAWRALRRFDRRGRFARGCWRSSPTRRATGGASAGRREAARAARRRRAGATPQPRPARRRRALLVAERDAALAAALERLDERDRQVIACRYLLELSEAETAAALGCRAGTVKSRLSRALARLRAQPEIGGLDG